MPTLAAVLGSKKPSSTDGVSFAPTLLGEDKLQENTAYRYSLWMKNDAIRVGDWKLIRMKQEPVELYNLAKDPSEKSNLIKNYPEKVKQLLPFFEEATRPL
jgi:arylsulfatase A-like enzyme